MDNFNLQKFVKKSKNEFYTNLYEGKKEHSMEEKMHDEDHKMEEKMHDKDHKMEENHQSLAPEVADRIEGLLNIPMKAKFLSAGVDLIADLLEDEMMDVGDIVSHLANELEKRVAFGTPSGDGELEEKKNLTNEVSMNASDLETAMALLGGILGLPAVAILSQKAQDKLKAVKAKGKEALTEEEGELTIDESHADPNLLKKLGIDDDAMEMVKKMRAAIESGKVKDEDLGTIEGVGDAIKKMVVDGAESFLKEADVEVDVEDEIPAMDLDLDTSTDEPDNKEVFSQLVDAYESAKELGDEKLTRQLANTITYFNKTIIFGDEE